MSLSVSEAVAVGAVVSAFLSALVALISIRWSKQAAEAKEAQISALRAQLDLERSQSPAEMRKQFTAMKEMLEEKIQDLQGRLDGATELLVEKSNEISEEKRAISRIAGAGRVLFGISDGEIAIRDLHALLYDLPGLQYDFGSYEPRIFQFYLKAVGMCMVTQEQGAVFVRGSAEWVLDYLLMPVLGCMKHEFLKPIARRLAGRIIEEMSETEFADEMPIYAKCIEAAERGFDFTKGDLPPDLKEELSIICTERRIRFISNGGTSLLHKINQAEQDGGGQPATRPESK